MSLIRLKDKTIKELQDIIRKNYGKKISKEQASEFGVSLLKLTRLALGALARKKNKEK